MSAGPAVKAVFFDVGNVLLRWRHSEALRRLARASGRPPALLAAFFLLEDAVDRLERGRLSPRGLHRLLRARLRYEGSWERFARLWCAPLRPAAGAAALLRDAARRRPVYLLSNTSALHFACMRRRFPFLRRARGAVLSYRLGLRKPEPDFFREALRRARARAEEAVLVDDRPENVAAARRLGLRTVRHRSVAGTRRALERMGALAAPARARPSRRSR